MAALTLIFFTMPATAREEIPLKAGRDWKHKHTGIAVPATLAATPRKIAIAYVPDDLDVGLSFSAGNDDESLSFYIFRNTNGGVPVWFAQAQWGIENRANFGSPKIALMPQAFAPPRQSTRSGLKAIYQPSKGPYLSTGVLLLPVGDWYVKLRASSTTRSPSELEQWMEEALGQIKWPKKVANGPVAVPVYDCPMMLNFAADAKDAEKDGAADLLSGMLGMMVLKKEVKPTAEAQAALANARWCRDASAGDNRQAYRRDEGADRYLLAMGDNGIGAWIGADSGAALLASAEKDPAKVKPPRYTVTIYTAQNNINYVAQDRMPSPKRVIELIDTDRRVTTVPTWGKKKEIQINSDVL
ncbi:MAG TPA: hypothetical protein VGN36_07525 [Sphingorhabdus sp.]|nr:hypothetical protein [Sphingorhabdus sp.]